MGAGDVNGDGFDDLIVGAREGNDGGIDAGEAYIIYGKAGNGSQFGTVMGGRQVLDTTDLAPTDGFIIQGDREGRELGSSVSGAGDVNGDGLADLIVGAIFSRKAYIIYGKAGTDGTQFGTVIRGRQVLDTTELSPTDGFTLRGDMREEDNNLGLSVAGAGDINGDGFDDLIVGANQGFNSSDRPGMAYIIYGGDHLGEVATHDQVRTGMEDDLFLLGGAGDDTLTAHADTEVLYSGAGDDTLELADASFRRVDGGSGSDTLVLGSSVTLDLTDAAARGRVRDVEVISLSDAGAMVTLDLAAVYALVEARDNGGTLTDAGEVLFRLEGTSGMVRLEGRWTMEQADAEGTADLWARGSVRLLVDDGLLSAVDTTPDPAETAPKPVRVRDANTLAPAHGFILQGDGAGDNLGLSVAGAGDINGDGIDDLIVGAPAVDADGSMAGEAYIIYGKAGPGDASLFGEDVNGRQVLDTTNLAAADGFILRGDFSGDDLGWSVAGAGDINGDGFDDLIVGADQGDDGGVNAGEAYVIYGKAGDGTQFGTVTESSRVLDTAELASTDGFIIQGEMAVDWLGWSVAGAGDINDDGIDDLIVGAPLGDDGGNNVGEAYIIYGKAGTGSQFGMLVRVLKSDGSTVTDGTSPSNSVERQVLDVTTLAPADGFILQGDEVGETSRLGREDVTVGDALGWSVAGAGDVNGDGIDDLIVGGPFSDKGDNSGNGAGEAYIIYGKAGPDGTQFGDDVETTLGDGTEIDRQVLDTTDELYSSAGFIIQGDERFDDLGWSVSGAGDVNGDGFDDLIVGAPGGYDGGGSAGEAYIIYGQAGTRRRLDTTDLRPTEGFIIQGDRSGDFLGLAVAGAGDINGDGLDDLIVGANEGNDGRGFFGADEGNDGGDFDGKAYIIYGQAGTDGIQFGVTIGSRLESRQVLDITGLLPTEGFIFQGDMEEDALDISVSGAGDINSDGFDDLIVGNSFGDEGGTEAGAAYILYGNPRLGAIVTDAQTRTGSPGEMSLLGGAGDDTLTAHADTEVLYGGAGDDTLTLVDASFRRVDGGSGFDTLVLGSGVRLDLTEAAERGRLRSVEVVSLSDAGARVTLDLAAAYALVETRDNGGTLTDPGETLLRLEGTSGMVVLSDAPSWTMEMADAEGTADLYAQGTARLLIDDGLLADPVPILDASELEPADGFILQGDMGGQGRSAGDQLGFPVAGAGDINGDGVDDLIVGARLGDDGGGNAGEAYIIYGKAGTAGNQFGEDVNGRQVLDTTGLEPTAGFILQGELGDGQLGWSVAGAGDINGDGLADFIVGAPFGDDFRRGTGEAYILYGKAGTAGTQFGEDVEDRQVLDITGLLPTDGFILQGDEDRDALGISVAGAGDINGDGLGDLVVGDRNGDSYIVYGKAGTQFGMQVRFDDDGRTISLADAEPDSVVRQVLNTKNLVAADGFILQNWGSSVSGAGDINGDGLADLIVGNPGDDLGGGRGSDAGTAYILYGKAGDDGTQFGERVPFDANGRPVRDGSRPAGLVERQVLNTRDLAPTDGFILLGDASYDGLGGSVSGAGDINGDGLDDLIVGARGSDDGGRGAGEAYIVYGKAGDGSQFGEDVNERQVLYTGELAPTEGFILQGDTGGDTLGISVAGAGDLNGDGLADLIVGASFGDNGGIDAGEAYILYGKAGTDGTQFGTLVQMTTRFSRDVPIDRQVLDITGLVLTDGFILQGDEAGDQLGWSVAGAGDINGDGFDDLIVGAPEGDDGGDRAGEAYIVYGGARWGDVTTDDQTFTGVAGELFLYGGAGDDMLEGHADTEVLYGGAGDDVLDAGGLEFPPRRRRLGR